MTRLRLVEDRDKVIPLRRGMAKPPTDQGPSLPGHLAVVDGEQGPGVTSPGPELTIPTELTEDQYRRLLQILSFAPAHPGDIQLWEQLRRGQVLACQASIDALFDRDDAA